ncbi:unnamed protein product [Cylicocyclus nassatus]|uniref:Arrestin C-terminal-like domain-containing protein n=1 Tax=Cylicocyclus nassatus TaxID=53992 RepID=A0AA36H987_CYLNA|nr:unnamed protein product [Cylicocyclus nassatus]
MCRADMPTICLCVLLKSARLILPYDLSFHCSAHSLQVLHSGLHFFSSMESIRLEVYTDKAVYVPGQSVTGSVFIVTPKAIAVDSVRARLFGDININFTNKDYNSFKNHRVFVNEEKELWHYSTLHELLDMSTVDMNANHCKTGYLTGKSQFRFSFQLPYDLATSFNCSGSPVQVKYFISVTLHVEDKIVFQQEQPISILSPQMVAKPVGSQKVVHSRCFPLPKNRSLYIECALDQTMYSPTGRLEASVTIANRWKQSIKYVHMNIVRKIEVVGASETDRTVGETNTVFMDTTGVGLPTSKRKIAVGETYTFRPSFNVPALPPNMEVPGLMRTSYLLKISVGRAYNYVIASLSVPITIVTDIIDVEPVVPASSDEDILIDLNPSSTWVPTNKSPIDLLA